MHPPKPTAAAENSCLTMPRSRLLQKKRSRRIPVKTSEIRKARHELELRHLRVPRSAYCAARCQIAVCIWNQHVLRLTDGVSLDAPHIETLLRTCLDKTSKYPSMQRKCVFARSHCERRLDLAESPRRNMETTRTNMWTTHRSHEHAATAHKRPS